MRCSRRRGRPIEEHELSVARDLLIIVGAFAFTSALAGALGAPNLGTALAFGQMAFAASVVYVMVKR